MDFALKPEQSMLQALAKRHLADHYDFAQRRVIVEGSGHAPQLWKDWAALGILGAALPEDAGGTGGGATETMVIAEALGSALVTEPFLETVVIGGNLLKRSGSAIAGTLLADIISGNAILAFAAQEPTARYALNDIGTTAHREGDKWILTGRKAVVVGAPVASHIIVAARTAGQQRDINGISLFLVDRGATGLTSHPYRLIDGRLAADLIFEEVELPAHALLSEEGKAFPLIEQVMDEATAALCADAVGGMRRMLQDTIDYTKQRRQFGQPLASFQALQHRMVDMYTALEQAVSALYLATIRLEGDAHMRALAISGAKVTIGRSTQIIGQNAIQLHGGMGMTDELAVGHYFRRATTIEGQFGSVDHHLARYASLSRSIAA